MTATRESQWLAGPRAPELRSGEIHLWRANLKTCAPAVPETLSVAERERGQRFHFEHDRERYLRSRSILRALLARYLGCKAGAIDFTFGPHGKPALSGTGLPLHFNLSHSADLLLIAIGHSLEVGVDVEWMRDGVRFQELADRFLDPDAAASLRELTPQDRAHRFYELWTSTEAQLKASGTGLSAGTRIIDSHRWNVFRIHVEEGYAAAVATEGLDPQLTFWSWE